MSKKSQNKDLILDCDQAKAEDNDFEGIEISSFTNSKEFSKNKYEINLNEVSSFLTPILLNRSQLWDKQMQKIESKRKLIRRNILTKKRETRIKYF